jgi:uncharacterized protein
VIGLNLCPFAKAEHVHGRIRYVVSGATTLAGLADALADEAEALQAADPAVIETTLLIHPMVLTDFLDYNDFLDDADELIEQLELGGVIQVASFHPQYQFEGTQADDAENFSNRSPYPTLHLLREASVEKAVAAFPETARIYERNVAELRELGAQGWADLKARADF